MVLTDLFQPFTTVKRKNELHRWEPFYIGTNEDPLFSEKLSWEGLQDKMTQVSPLQLLYMVFTNWCFIEFGNVFTRLQLHNTG